MTFDEFKNLVLYRRITEWDKNKIVLDNGVKISIEETAFECCATAFGEFKDVILDAAITDVSSPEYSGWGGDDDWDGGYGTDAVVKFLHNRNIVARAEASADSGNGGFYYSVASFVVRLPDRPEDEITCSFVGADDGFNEEVNE